MVDTISISGRKLLQLWGQNGWSANVQKEFYSDSEVIGCEVYVYVRADDIKGSGKNIVEISFLNLEAYVWGKRFVAMTSTIMAR